MEHDKSKQHAQMALVAMCLMYFIWTGICWFTLTVYAEPMINDWGITRSQFMISVTTVSLSNALMSLIFYGPIQAKIGTRRLMLVGGVLSCLSYVVFALANGLAMLYLAALMFGVGVSALNANTAYIVIGKWYKKNAAKLTGLAQTCGSVTGIVCATVFAMICNTYGWRIARWITFIIAVIVTIAITVLFKGEPDELGETPMYADASDTEVSTEQDGIGLKEMFADSRFYMQCVGYLILGAAGYAVMGNLTLIAADFGFSKYAGTVLSVCLIANAVGLVPGGAICDRFGSKWLDAICMASLIGAILMIRSGNLSLGGLYIAGVLLGVAYLTGLLPCGISVREAFGNKEYSKKVGIVNAFCFLGVSFGPLTMAFFYDRFGNYNMGMNLFMILAVIGVALIFLGTRTEKSKNVNIVVTES